ncbi:MAG TPA: NlpC/P60 family protein [Candidatus Nanopelagicales bacterium]|nr:NlpC/P60 family protein [Candidatus Nanopelagicales bacterium]
MSFEIATVARDFERTVGHEILYSEMVCNQFVVAVLRKAVDPAFPMIRADDFAHHPRMMKVDQPQAGDLVHWPGHIGIVLDPDNGDFIGSQTSTGVAVANYKKGYWNGNYGGKKADTFLRYIP